MRIALAIALVLAPVAARAERPDDLVDVATVIPDAVLDLRYASEHNFVGEALYPVARCKLRRAVAARLAKVAELLRAQERRLLLWDCYRPRSVQQMLWDKATDKRFVADPRKGSRHSRGAAIDLAIVDADGAAVVLPTAFDDFTRAAHRSRALAGKHGVEAKRLARAMLRAGFVAIPHEWWHYEAPEAARYKLSDEPL